MIMKPACNTSIKAVAMGILALVIAVPLIYSGPPARGGGARGGAAVSRGGSAPRIAPSRAPVQNNTGGVTSVNRSYHGTIRHAETHVYQRPAEGPRRFEPQQHAIVHRDVDVDVNRPRFWHDFSPGARRHRLREGFISLFLGGVPYFYDDGIYYQQVGDDYQEVYPPVGAIIGQLPDGAIEIDADNSVYYYAAGAFYVQQDGGFVIAPTPIGVTVPELPPGAIPATVNNTVAYQFNGVYYQPLFVNGVTQYLTFLP